MDVPLNQKTFSERYLRWAQRACMLVGGCAILWCLFGYADMAFFQAREAWQFETLRQNASVKPTVRPAAGGLVGKIRIPSIGLSAMVVNGDDAKALRHAVGHISGTGYPEAGGTVGIAGHRDTFFRSLGRMQNDDEIVLETPSATYRYRVARTAIVEPDDVGVLKRVAHPSLVLVTCYPFNFVGHAPRRYIVTARQTGMEVSPVHRY